MKYISHSRKETKKFAQYLAKKMPTNMIALTGELGTGKTTFTQGFAKSLGIKDKIISPTFVLIRQYKIPKSKRILFHIDLYRLEDSNQFKNLGLEDIINDLNHIIIIEWAEKIKKLLPKNTLWISFEQISENKRLITFF